MTVHYRGGRAAAARKSGFSCHRGSNARTGGTTDDLDLATRILAVCDVYDALVSPRVYRDAWSVEKALAHLQSETDTRFDARCVTSVSVSPGRV